MQHPSHTSTLYRIAEENEKPVKGGSAEELLLIIVSVN